MYEPNCNGCVAMQDSRDWEKIDRWHEELYALCQGYLERDKYIYMGLIQKFGELDKILETSYFTEKGDKNE